MIGGLHVQYDEQWHIDMFMKTSDAVMVHVSLSNNICFLHQLVSQLVNALSLHCNVVYPMKQNRMQNVEICNHIQNQQVSKMAVKMLHSTRINF